MKKTTLRKQAEETLSKRKKSLATDSNADALRLVHELQVHQIELEMQNEELVQSHAELEAALRQYTDLYDFSPVGYFTLTRNGMIRQLNLAGAALLGAGAERGKLVKRRLGIFVTAQSRTTFNAFLEKVFITGNNEDCEIMLLKEGHELCWVHLDAVCSEDRLECRVVMKDITERVRAEEALRHLSIHDALTGLYNRSFFVAEMERLERGRQFPVSIVMADVDGLKHTNDQEGHAAGDARLKGVAQMFTTAFRTEDVVARIGGDEFAVLLPNTDAASAKVLLGRVQYMIQENNSTHPETPILLSIGVSTAENPMPLPDVLKKADVNMYLEKRGNDVS